MEVQVQNLCLSVELYELEFHTAKTLHGHSSFTEWGQDLALAHWAGEGVTLPICTPGVTTPEQPPVCRTLLGQPGLQEGTPCYRNQQPPCSVPPIYTDSKALPGPACTSGSAGPAPGLGTSRASRPGGSSVGRGSGSPSASASSVSLAPPSVPGLGGAS